MKLLAFAASSSKQSINKQFAEFAISILKDLDTELLDLNDYELPLYSVDREKEEGIPDLVGQFCEKLKMPKLQN
jgi:NAD(P)H-dependent FMN reductase